MIGVDRVSFSALGSGFGSKKFGSGQAQINFFCIFQSILAVFGKKLAIFLKKNFFGLLGFLKKLLGSGWPKRPRVGSNFGSGFDPTHPYRRRCIYFFPFRLLSN